MGFISDNDGHGQGRRSRSSGKSQPLTASRESDSPLQLAGNLVMIVLFVEPTHSSHPLSECCL